MRDWLTAALVVSILLGFPISTGYFYERPFCKSDPRERAGCAFFMGLVYPFALPANIAARVFE